MHDLKLYQFKTSSGNAEKFVVMAKVHVSIISESLLLMVSGVVLVSEPSACIGSTVIEIVKTESFWCLCNQPSVGTMIVSDHDGCTYNTMVSL